MEEGAPGTRVWLVLERKGLGMLKEQTLQVVPKESWLQVVDEDCGPKRKDGILLSEGKGGKREDGRKLPTPSLPEGWEAEP